VLIKKGGYKMNCLKCNKDLKETGIGYAEKGTMLYNLSLDSQGDLQWEQENFENGGEGEFYCVTCGSKIEGLDEENVIEVLK
jgi:hypothetical protein